MSSVVFGLIVVGFLLMCLAVGGGILVDNRIVGTIYLIPVSIGVLGGIALMVYAGLIAEDKRKRNPTTKSDPHPWNAGMSRKNRRAASRKN
jgi:hypothetical protein